MTSYRWRGRDEQMLRFGVDCPVQAIVFSPLFEEWNKTRRFIVELLRGLAARGVGSALPDLPGTGESLHGLESLDLDDWRDAARNAADQAGSPVLAISFRGGALVDEAAAGASVWRLAPLDGASIVRDLMRASRIAGSQQDSSLHSGYPLSPALLTTLQAADISDNRVRTVRLTTDAKPADRHVEGTPLWRRSEPGEDQSLGSVLAEDIQSWAVSCGNS